MNEGAIELSALDVGLAALLVLVAGAVSLALRLRLEGRLAIASLRTVAQLLLVGYILRWVFDLQSPLLIAAVVAVMLVAASFAAVRRPSRAYPGVTVRALVTLVLTGILTVYIVTGLIIDAQPWYRPQYLIPLLGMILGNSLTGISLALDTLLESLHGRWQEVETDLALGATRWEAATPPLRDAVRRGMIPIINTMMVVGIVSLPGMMTGQILEGADPLKAVSYQIVVMFMLAASTAMGSIGVGLLTCLRLFNHRHQLVARDVRMRE
ncbi:MAG: ABC transporter permease [Phycisphaeraceae bacterium]